MNIGNRGYFFCRSKKIMKHLRYESNISFITNAIDIKTGQEFWLFERTELLNNALNELDKCGDDLLQMRS